MIEKNWQQFETIVRNWKTHCVEFSKMVQPPEQLRPALEASGAPSTFAALDPSISSEKFTGSEHFGKIIVVKGRLVSISGVPRRLNIQQEN